LQRPGKTESRSPESTLRKIECYLLTAKNFLGTIEAFLEQLKSEEEGVLQELMGSKVQPIKAQH